MDRRYLTPEEIEKREAYKAKRREADKAKREKSGRFNFWYYSILRGFCVVSFLFTLLSFLDMALPTHEVEQTIQFNEWKLYGKRGSNIQLWVVETQDYKMTLDKSVWNEYISPEKLILMVTPIFNTVKSVSFEHNYNKQYEPRNSMAQHPIPLMILMVLSVIPVLSGRPTRAFQVCGTFALVLFIFMLHAFE